MNYRKFLLPVTLAFGLGANVETRAASHQDDDNAVAASQPFNGPQTGALRSNETTMVSIIGATGAITEQPAEILSWDDTSETSMRFNGRSWTVTRKDLRTGEIQRFKQSEIGSLGQLEVIQTKPEPDAADALHRSLFTWMGTEDTRQAHLVSRELGPLPKSMRFDVADAILSMPTTAGDAINNLLPDKVRREMAAENKALAASLNGQNATAPANGGRKPIHSSPSPSA